MRGDNRGWKEREEKEEEEECVIDWLVPNAQRRKERMWRGRADGYIHMHWGWSGKGAGFMQSVSRTIHVYIAFACILKASF